MENFCRLKTGGITRRRTHVLPLNPYDRGVQLSYHLGKSKSLPGKSSMGNRLIVSWEVPPKERKGKDVFYCFIQSKEGNEKEKCEHGSKWQVPEGIYVELVELEPPTVGLRGAVSCSIGLFQEAIPPHLIGAI